MKKIVLISLFIGLEIGLSKKTIAQEISFEKGYMIKLNHDTIHGLIAYRNDHQNSKSCIFRKNNQAEPETFKPGEIKGYRYTNGRYYVTKEIEIGDSLRKRFVEFFLDGIANLYYYHTGISSQWNYQITKLSIITKKLKD